MAAVLCPQIHIVQDKKIKFIECRQDVDQTSEDIQCWFERDVTAAMLVVKNKSITLLWELTLFSCKFFEEIFFCFDPQHGRLVTWLQTKNYIFDNLLLLFFCPCFSLLISACFNNFKKACEGRKSGYSLLLNIKIQLIQILSFSRS